MRLILGLLVASLSLNAQLSPNQPSYMSLMVDMGAYSLAEQNRWGQQQGVRAAYHFVAAGQHWAVGAMAGNAAFPNDATSDPQYQWDTRSYTGLYSQWHLLPITSPWNLNALMGAGHAANSTVLTGNDGLPLLEYHSGIEPWIGVGANFQYRGIECSLNNVTALDTYHNLVRTSWTLGVGVAYPLH